MKLCRPNDERWNLSMVAGDIPAVVPAGLSKFHESPRRGSVFSRLSRLVENSPVRDLSSDPPFEWRRAFLKLEMLIVAVIELTLARWRRFRIGDYAWRLSSKTVKGEFHFVERRILFSSATMYLQLTIMESFVILSGCIFFQFTATEFFNFNCKCCRSENDKGSSTWESLNFSELLIRYSLTR